MASDSRRESVHVRRLRSGFAPVEFAGGPFWTDLGGRIREEANQFNFVLTGGVGVSWFITPQLAFNAGYRFHHIFQCRHSVSESWSERESALRWIFLLFLRRRLS